MQTAQEVEPDRIVVPERIDARPLWRRLAGPVAVGVGAIGVCAYLAAVNPNESGHYPECPSRALFGVDCPGCGGMRGMYSLLHGDVSGALDHNLLLFAIVPIAIGLWALWLMRAIRGRYPQVSHRQFTARNRLMYLSLVVLVGFGIVRNFVPYLGSGV